MHMLIAFAVTALGSFFPVFLFLAMAQAVDVPGRTSGRIVVLQAVAIALGLGLVAALIVGGIAAVLATLFGG